jgi:hypothetical protein
MATDIRRMAVERHRSPEVRLLNSKYAFLYYHFISYPISVSRPCGTSLIINDLWRHVNDAQEPLHVELQWTASSMPRSIVADKDRIIGNAFYYVVFCRWRGHESIFWHGFVET